MFIKKAVLHCFLYWLDYFSHIVYFMNKLKSFFSLSSTFTCFKILKVYSRNSDVTKHFLKNIPLDFSHCNTLCFEWIFDNTIYKQYLNKSTLKHFFPYTFYDMRNHTPDCKIIAALVTDNTSQIIVNETRLFKQIAGPKQNFFKDVYQINTKDIFGLQDKKLQLITSKSSLTFDLLKENVLEL